MLKLKLKFILKIGLKTTNSKWPLESDVKETINVSYSSFCSDSFRKLELVERKKNSKKENL